MAASPLWKPLSGSYDDNNDGTRHHLGFPDAQSPGLRDDPGFTLQYPRRVLTAAPTLYAKELKGPRSSSCSLLGPNLGRIEMPRVAGSKGARVTETIIDRFISLISAAIQSVPPEVLERCIEHLAFGDVCNLRLSCRTFAAWCAQDTFKSYFLSKHVDMTKEKLEAFVEQTRPGRLGCLVEHVILTGVAVDTQLLGEILQPKTRWVTESHGPLFSSEQHRCTPAELLEVEADLKGLKALQTEQAYLRDNGESVGLLAEAFRNIASNGKLGLLPHLAMDVAVYRQNAETKQLPAEGGDWDRISQAAADCFHMTMSSLAKSGLLTTRLDIFSSASRCNLGCGELYQLGSYNSLLAQAMSGMKSLSLSLSERHLVDSGEQPDHEMVEALSSTKSDPSALPNFFALMPQLEDLNLHWYRTYQPGTRRLNSEPFHGLSEHVCLTALTQCSLRGLFLSERSFLTFLQRVPVKRLFLEEVHMVEGSFTPVFEYCTSEEANMEYLWLDDLWQVGLLYFHDSTCLKFPRRPGRGIGGQTLERRGNELRRPILWGFPPGRAPGSRQLYRWRALKKHEFGPP
ncbi:hypothetical protein LTR37_000948 [Vermiconidia calcicola]|uniref:Uncharacterized protein n=1 Tax=Vermiconidia calcicola TaxID=1690605 RepID=A0ACC3NZ39_9PEZI|nr:hypothetical protein LTR37_000948 [Vermiconidia calcicola]